MHPSEQRAKAILDKLQGVSNPVVAELGVFIGALSRQLLRQRPDMTLYMVDCWGENISQEYKDTNDFHANASKEQQNGWKANCLDAVAPYVSNTIIMDMTTLEAAKLVEDNFFDLVFIDADHSYKGCKEDIEAWEGKVKEGGWLGGHDYDNNEADFQFGVTEAVDEYISKTGKELFLAENYTWFTKR